MTTDQIKNEIKEIKKWKEKINLKDLKYEPGKYKYDFQQYKKIRYFDESIYSEKISIHDADMAQANLLENLKKINEKSKRKSKEGKDKNEIVLIV